MSPFSVRMTRGGALWCDPAPVSIKLSRNTRLTPPPEFGRPLLALVEKTVGIYNDALARDVERLERPLNETEDGQAEPPLSIDLAGLIENVQGAAKAQVGYMLDMAKADALDLLGETRQAFELVDRHV